MSRRMSRRKKQKEKRWLVWRAVKAGVTSVDKIRAILARHGHRPHDDAILVEIERARQQIREEQDRESAVREGVVPFAVPAARPVPAANPAEMLQHVIDTPMEELSFEDFVNLKSGYDEYSTLRYRDLVCMVLDSADVDSVLRNDKLLASCLRWMLRGLPMEKAIRKVQTDAEVAKNARKAQRRR